MTQTIVQGPEDPLLVLDHQGGSGNPTLVIQQDENAVAYIWWDQVNQIFHMGPASAGRPSLSIGSNGRVEMPAGMPGLTVGDLLVNGGGLVANAANISQLTAGGLLVQQQGATITGGGLVADSANISQLTAGGLLVQQAATITGGGLVADSANISQLTAGGLVVQNGARLTGGMEVDRANITELTAFGLVVQNGARLTGGMVADNVNVSGTVTAGSYLTSSSGEIKENIADLSSQEALEVLEHLSPVTFNLKADETKKVHIGFIAEHVHQSVASSDGKGINVMDIVAILTRVVKEQQKAIDALVAKTH
jgi:hypothetical protein